MALQFSDIAVESTATTGTGTLSLGGAVQGYLGFAAAGITSGNSVPYQIINGTQRETGWGVFTNAATDTLTRVADWSTDGEGVELTLSGTSIVSIGPIASLFTLGAGTGINADLLDSKTTGTSGNAVALLDGANTWSALQTNSLAGNTARFVNTTDNDSVQVARFEGDRATPTAGDAGYVSYDLSDNGGAQTEISRFTWTATDIANGSEDGTCTWHLMEAGTLSSKLHMTSAVLRPFTDDTIALGQSNRSWSDLFLASGGTVHFANTDWVATHTTGILTVGTGDLRVTTAGTNAASAVTVGGTQTLTNKLLAFPATQNSSADANTLDDYEEGTWTPAITFGGAAVALTYSVQTGAYTKIGNSVRVSGQITITSNGTSSGQCNITGFPFTNAASTGMPLRMDGTAATTSGGVDGTMSAGDIIMIPTEAVTGNSAALTEASVLDGTVFYLGGVYYV